MSRCLRSKTNTDAQMNEMRIHVGLGASICGIRGYQESLNYAVERKQGKGGFIINYADVKRQLLQQKVFSEGSLSLCLFAASLNDSKDKSDQVRNESLRTPRRGHHMDLRAFVGRVLANESLRTPRRGHHMDL